MDFYPRPEAHPQQWERLVPPVRNAVSELLGRIEATLRRAESMKDSNELFANCFLVYGERGTGKSTVLLSAQQAIKSISDNLDQSFFASTPFYKDDAEATSETPCEITPCKLFHNQKKKTLEHAKSLDSAIWLDVLDLEPLPKNNNMLTTVLTRIRAGMNDDQRRNRDHEGISLLEEARDSARQQIERLISDATLMWEDIQETDTRNRANRQIEAAQIYSRFRNNFQRAIKCLSQETSRRHGKDRLVPIVLPIDNIDRSTEHLQSIIKLAQMITCPEIIVVMAGDRINFDTFLERAYWKELIRVEGGGATIGKVDLSGEDEALVMARRQAAAASQKLLPPSHRIEVKRMTAEETLSFDLNNGYIPSWRRQNPPEVITIQRLLSSIPVPRSKLENEGTNLPTRTWQEIEACQAEKGNCKPMMIDMFVFPDFLFKHLDKLNDNVFKARITIMGEYGLWLPARNVIDLWQLAHWALQNQDGFKAQKVAHAMLRYLIAPSSISSHLGLILKDTILRIKPDGSILLDLYTSKLLITRLFNPVLRFNYPESLYNHTHSMIVSTELEVNDINGLSMEIGQSPEKPSNTFDNSTEGLDFTIACWLATLHDIVMFSEQSAVVGSDIPTAQFVRVIHRVAYISNPDNPTWKKSNQKISLIWPAPVWTTYWAHNLFNLFFGDLAGQLDKKAGHAAINNIDTFLPRLLWVWIACCVDIWVAIAPDPGNWHKEDDPNSRSNPKVSKSPDLEKLIDGLRNKPLSKSTNNNDGEAKEIIEALNNIHETLAREGGNNSCSARQEFYEWTKMMAAWLENKLPLLLSYPYFPIHHSKMIDKITMDESRPNSSQPIKSLRQVWQRRTPFILAELNQELDKMHGEQVDDRREVCPELPEEFTTLQQDLWKSTPS